MPVDDDDLTRALRDAAPAVEHDDVVARVAARRARRRTARRARVGVLTGVVIALGIGGVALAVRANDPARINAPAASRPTTTTVAPPEGWTAVNLATDEGYLRGPLTLSQDGDRVLVSVAAYDRDGDGFTFPPSRIVRFDPATMRVVDRVDLQAEILDVVDGDAASGVRYALTRNPDPDGPTLPGLFLKRIAPDGSVRSTPLPPGTTTNGAITWGRGSGEMYVSPDRAVGFDRDGQLTGQESQFLLISPPQTQGFDVVPQGDVSAARSTGLDGKRVWWQGIADGVPAVALEQFPEPLRVVTVPGGTDTTFAWVDDDTVLATSGGRLYRYTGSELGTR